MTEKPLLPKYIYDHNICYQVGEKLGEGGFGLCHKVTNTTDNSIYACKAILKITSHEYQWKSEIDFLKSFDHPNLCKYISDFDDKNYKYIIMELYENRSLEDMINQRRRLTEFEVRFFMLQLIPAIKYLHDRNILHLDLKPQNLFLTLDYVLKVGDMGLAQQLVSKDQKITRCGTLKYMAPEVIDGKEYSFKADIWSLGVILYTLVIGTTPFNDTVNGDIYKNIMDLDYGFPSDIPITNGLRSLIIRILQLNPEDRPTLDEIYFDPYFENDIPKKLPKSSFYHKPNFSGSFELNTEYRKVKNELTSIPTTTDKGLQVRSSSLFQEVETSYSSLQVWSSSLFEEFESGRESLYESSPANLNDLDMKRAVLQLPDMSKLSVIEEANFNIKQAYLYIESFNTVNGLERLQNINLANNTPNYNVPLEITEHYELSNAFVYVTSTRMIQIVFEDNVNLFLSHGSRVITVIDNFGILNNYSMLEIIACHFDIFNDGAHNVDDAAKLIILEGVYYLLKGAQILLQEVYNYKVEFFDDFRSPSTVCEYFLIRYPEENIL